jgi:hypothetical protein
MALLRSGDYADTINHRGDLSMKDDAAFKKFVWSWIGMQSKSRAKYKLYIVDKSFRRKRVKGNGVFLEFADGSGMFISAMKRGKGDTACFMSWPDGPQKHSRFITKACCSNVIEVGVEVYQARKK